MRSSQNAFSATVPRGAAGAIASQPPAGRRARRARETRLRLLEAALQLFAGRGFQNVTVEEITEAADVGKGTFFNYFESKDHVLATIAELQLAHIQRAAEATQSGRRSIHSILQHLFLCLGKELGRSPEFARTVAASLLANEVVRDMVQCRMAECRSVVASVFGEGQVRGEINPRLHRNAMALQMQQVLLGTVMLWSLYGEDNLTARITSSFRLFWRAIAADGQESRR